MLSKVVLSLQKEQPIGWRSNSPFAELDVEHLNKKGHDFHHILYLVGVEEFESSAR